MQKYRNVLFILLAVILFIYAAFISIYPSMITKNFNMDKFEQNVLDAAGLDVTIGYLDIKIKPNFKTIIVMRDFDARYPDQQPLFNAKYMEIITTPSALLSKDFDIKSMTIKNMEYNDQILPNGLNKLAYLPASFNPEPFGKNKITVKPGDIKIKNAKFVYTITLPYSYDIKSFREISYTKNEVRDFLLAQGFSKLIVK